MLLSSSQLRFTVACALVCSVGCGGDDGKSTPSDHAKTDASTSATTHPDAGTAKSDASVGTTGKSDASAPSTDTSKYKSDYDAWQAANDKLRSCGLLDNGTIVFEPDLDFRCDNLCVLPASCADLMTQLCDDNATTGSVLDCIAACADDTISCGDGTTVDASLVCDTKRDCSNGEDEKHCGQFNCKSGDEVIDAYAQCDGEMDCTDGSDEKGCALFCGQPIGYSSTGVSVGGNP